MYQVYGASYCGSAHAIENECDCEIKRQYCCHSSSRCHIVLSLQAMQGRSNMFSFNYFIEENSHVMPGGKIPDECTINASAFDVYIHGKNPPFVKVDSVGELLPLLQLYKQDRFSIKKHDPLEIKEMVKEILDEYRDDIAISNIKHRQEIERPDIASNFLANIDLTNRVTREIAIEREMISSHDWILNPEYTEDELAIEHPFFGNISEMVAMRIAAIDELRNLVEDYYNPPIVPVLK